MSEDPRARAARIRAEARLNIAKADASLGDMAERRAAVWAERADSQARVVAAPKPPTPAPSSAAASHSEILRIVDARVKAALDARPYGEADIIAAVADALGRTVAVERKRSRAELTAAIEALRAELAPPAKPKTSRRRQTPPKPTQVSHAQLSPQVADLLARRRGAA